MACSVDWLLSVGFGFSDSVVSVCFLFVLLVSGGLLVVISVCLVVLGCVCFRGFVLFLGCLGMSLFLCCIVSGLCGEFSCCSIEGRGMIWVSPFFSFGVVLKKFCRVVCFRRVALRSFWNLSLAFFRGLGIMLVFSSVVGCAFITCGFRLGLGCGICWFRATHSECWCSMMIFPIFLYSFRRCLFDIPCFIRDSMTSLCIPPDRNVMASGLVSCMSLRMYGGMVLTVYVVVGSTGLGFLLG